MLLCGRDKNWNTNNNNSSSKGDSAKVTYSSRKSERDDGKTEKDYGKAEKDYGKKQDKGDNNSEKGGDIVAADKDSEIKKEEKPSKPERERTKVGNCRNTLVLLCLIYLLDTCNA